MVKYTYKDIGIEWLGEIPEHWKADRLRDNCIVNDKTLGNQTPNETIINYLDISNVASKGVVNFDEIKELSFEEAPSRARRITKKYDTVISSVRTNLQAVAYLDFDMGNLICSTGFFVCRPIYKAKLNNRFLYYFLLTEYSKDYFFSRSVGVSYPAIDDYKFSTINIPLPPLPEQKAIANYLDKACKRIDKIIAIKQKQLEKIDESLRSTISKTFSQGLDDNCSTKIVEGYEYLGCLSKKWKVTQLKFVFDFLDNRRVPLSSAERGEMTNKTYNYYGASGVIDKVEDFMFNEPLILLGEDGANLITRSKPLAFIATGKYWVNNHAHVLKPKFGDIDFWCILLENIDYSLYVTGAAQPKLSNTNLGKLKIAFPKTKEEQKLILKKIAYLEQKTKEIKQNITTQITTLQSYRKSLIHECVTGKKQVWEGAIENVN